MTGNTYSIIRSPCSGYKSATWKVMFQYLIQEVRKCDFQDPRLVNAFESLSVTTEFEAIYHIAMSERTAKEVKYTKPLTYVGNFYLKYIAFGWDVNSKRTIREKYYFWRQFCLWIRCWIEELVDINDIQIWLVQIKDYGVKWTTFRAGFSQIRLHLFFSFENIVRLCFVQQILVWFWYKQIQISQRITD